MQRDKVLHYVSDTVEEIAVREAEPAARCYRLGTMRYEIRRHRKKSDPPALVKYFIMSAMCDSPEDAWKSAANKLRDSQE